MGFLEQQVKRKSEVEQYLNETAYLEKEATVKTQSGASESAPAVGETFKGDAVKLGKKAWKPTHTEKERNEKIDRAKSLTSRATADTLELHEMCEKRKDAKLKFAGEAPAKVEHMVSLLHSVDFDPKMLTTASIKAHFNEYMTLIDAYDKLTELADIQKKEAMEAYSQSPDINPYARMTISKRLEPVSEQMTILKKRMAAFMGANGLKLDGSVLEKNETAPTFVFTEKDKQAFKKVDLPWDAKRTHFNEAKLSQKEFDLEALKKTLEAGDEATGYVPPVYTDVLSELDSVSRVQSITRIRACLKANENMLKLYNDYIRVSASSLNEILDEKFPNPAHIVELRQQIAMYTDLIAEVKKEMIEVKACLLLAEAEAKYVLADEAHKAEAALAARSAEDDYQRILRRNLKLSMPLTSMHTERTKSGVTKAEATGSESDLANFAFKQQLFDWSQKDMPGIPPQLKTAVAQYASVTHYSVESSAESDLLKTVLRMRERVADKQNPALTELNDILKSITDTGSDIPDWNDIPEDFREDSLQHTRFHSSKLEMSKEELAKHDHLPEETKMGKQAGSHRNFALSGILRVWKNLDNDTPVFAHEPTINDLRQGKVSNCYMLAGTTGLINLDPQLIKKCIKDNNDGTVTVRLYKPSERIGAPRIPVFVRIPKRVPKLVTGGEILSSGALWMQLIERACAQVNMFREGRFGYQSLWYGKGDEWLSILTGASSKTLYEDGQFSAETTGVEQNADTLFEMMTSAKSKNMIFHAGTKHNTTEGMNSGHAYTVLGTKIVDEKRYVVLRNPYANMSRVTTETGKIEKSSSYASSVADETYGQFDMPYEEFLQAMQTVSVSYMDEAFKTEQKDGKDISLQDLAELERTSKTATEAVGEGDDDLEEMDELFAEAKRLGIDTKDVDFDQLKDLIKAEKAKRGETDEE